MIALPAPRAGWQVMGGTALLLAPLAAPLAALPLGAQLALSLPCVAAFGLPHGATDWWLAAERLPALLPASLRALWALVFGLCYLAVAAVAAGAIMAAPGPALLVFIAISAWHFGAVDAGALALPISLPAVLGLGLLPIAAPALLHPQAVAELVHALGVTQTAANVAVLGACGTILALLAPWLAAPQAGRSLFAEQAACLLLMAAASPLLGFLVYFCLVHAPRQAAAVSLRGNKLAVWASATAAAALMAAFVAWGGWHARALPPLAAQALFWGLAVLTFPHVLCDRILRRAPAAHPATAQF